MTSTSLLTSETFSIVYGSIYGLCVIAITIYAGIEFIQIYNKYRKKQKNSQNESIQLQIINNSQNETVESEQKYEEKNEEQYLDESIDNTFDNDPIFKYIKE
eukprot:378834_1